MKTCILVLGAPRSGTSCVAGVLHHLGVPMGERFPEPDEWNPAGYFQDEDFEDWLNLYDFWWDKTKPMEGLRLSDKEIVAEIEKVIDKRNEQFDLWGLKSNLIAHFVPMFAAKTDLKVIRVSRPIAASVASWKARSGNTQTESSRVISYVNSLIDAKLTEANVTPLTIKFTDMVSDPATAVAKIADVAGVETKQSAVDWIQPALVRFQNG